MNSSLITRLALLASVGLLLGGCPTSFPRSRTSPSSRSRISPTGLTNWSRISNRAMARTWPSGMA